MFYYSLTISVCEEAPGICAHLLTLFSILIIVVTLPFSLLMVVKVVQVCLGQFMCFH
jgi:hypothetical protein